MEELNSLPEVREFLRQQKEKVITDFAETLYGQAIQQRYGIRPCGICKNPDLVRLEYDLVAWIILQDAEQPGNS